jgi:hypothetical protein
MLADLLPVAAEAGLLGIVATIFGMLHRSAVAAYKQQTADWRETARLERQAHEQARQQLMHVLAPLRTTAGSAS